VLSHFVSYALMLTALRAVGLHWSRLSSRVLSCVSSNVFLLGVSSISGNILRIARGIISGVRGWIGCYVCSDVGSRVDRLCDFVFASSLFSHGLKGGIVVVSLMRSLRPTRGVGA
jgi:hypothetical protein